MTLANTIRIAVLPFSDLSPGQENDYLSEGITHELINALMQVPSLRVTAETSAFKFRDKRPSPAEIGRQLHVEKIITGTVRTSGNRVRVTAQVIDSEQGIYSWSDKYDRELEDLFELEDELATTISKAVRDTLELDRVGAGQGLVRPPTRNIKAYNSYLKGRHYWGQWTTQGALKGVRYFEDAIAIDPRFALAHAGLANCYSTMGVLGHMDAAEAYEKTKALTHKALQLDDRLAESHISMAMMKLFNESDFVGAGRSFRRALALNPRLPDVHMTYSFLLNVVGDDEGAVREMEIAVQQDPLSLPYLSSLAYSLMIVHRYVEAHDYLDRALDLDSSYRIARLTKGFIYLREARFEEALQVFEAERGPVTDPMKVPAVIGYLQAKLGNRQAALAAIEELKALEADPQHQLLEFKRDMALVWGALGK